MCVGEIGHPERCLQSRGGGRGGVEVASEPLYTGSNSICKEILMVLGT